MERAINCQRCVVAHEARLRGYDVTTRPSWDISDSLLKISEWLKVFEEAKLDKRDCAGQNVEEVTKKAKEIMQPFGKGARAFIRFNWANTQRNWHVIVAECRENGVVVFGDPQMRVVAASKYFAEANLKS